MVYDYDGYEDCMSKIFGECSEYSPGYPPLIYVPGCYCVAVGDSTFLMKCD